MTHVDIVHHPFFAQEGQENNYVKWFFFLHRLPKDMKNDFCEQLAQYKLFCDYRGLRYRVIGPSSLDHLVWLTKNFDSEIGYHCVDLDKCSNWSPNP